MISKRDRGRSLPRPAISSGDWNAPLPHKALRRPRSGVKHTPARKHLVACVDAFLKALSVRERLAVETWVDKGGDMWIEVRFS